MAGELLGAGETSPALIELFALPDLAAPWEGPPLFETALDEIGAPSLTNAEAAALIARDLADAILSGSRTLAEGCSEGAQLYYLTHYEHKPLALFYELDDELGSLDRSGRTNLGRTPDDLIQEIRAFAQTAQRES